MTLYANFTETGDCVYVGTAPGQTQLPSEFTGLFPKRYRMVDGEVVDTQPGKTDAQAEIAWHQALDEARAAAQTAADETPAE